jgi:lysozyme
MICERAIELIKHFESLHDGDLTVIGLQPKQCPAGIWTVGYGRALRNLTGTRFLKGEADKAQAYERFPELTEKQAAKLLAFDLEKFELDVKRFVKVPLNENQTGALVSFAYNLGSNALKESTLLRKLNAHDYHGASFEFRRWTKAGGVKLRGLIRRRNNEKRLFLGQEFNFEDES